MSAELAVRRPPVVRFSGGPNAYRLRRLGLPEPAVAYRVPRNTLDERYEQCTNHRVACDCREAELNEQLEEHRLEWQALRRVTRSALAGHQLEDPREWRGRDRRSPGLCLCSGCVITRAHGGAFRYGDVDWDTGRVLPVEPAGVPF